MTRERGLCPWPHYELGSADELLLGVAFDRHAPFITAMARRLARHSGMEAADFIQEALIRMWEIGPRQALELGDRLRPALVQRMKNLRRNEWRRWTRDHESLDARS